MREVLVITLVRIVFMGILVTISIIIFGTWILLPIFKNLGFVNLDNNLGKNLEYENYGHNLG